MTSDLEQLSAAFGRVPLLEGCDPSAATRLAGLTNLNYLVETPELRVVVRLPGSGTSEYIDRRAESVAARSAADAGVNAEVLHFDARDGLMVTRFLEGAVTMDAARFRDLAAVARAGEAFARLHRTARPFSVDFQLFTMIDEYKSLLASKGAALPEGYELLERRADAARAAIESQPVDLVPSHCDPLCENFLDDGQRMFVIDYEYAGNNDPMWDLGDLSVEGGFGPAQDAALLAAYFGGEPPATAVGRMVLYKALCDLLWTLWGVIQHVNENPADDFWAYATGRFERCRTLMSSDEFSDHVDVVTRG